MTAQISDTFLFKGDEYSLIGMTGGPLVVPEQFGMEPEELHTACYRGFYATYELTDDALLLRKFTVRDMKGEYPPIGGVEPVVEDGRATYEGLALVVDFTGSLRMAAEFIDEYYVHMGFQKPSAYKTVVDVTLENGRLVAINDRSDDVEKIRGTFKKGYGHGCSLQKIKDAFRLDMELV